jgi:hypothetical protein
MQNRNGMKRAKEMAEEWRAEAERKKAEMAQKPPSNMTPEEAELNARLGRIILKPPGTSPKPLDLKTYKAIRRSVLEDKMPIERVLFAVRELLLADTEIRVKLNIKKDEDAGKYLYP